MRAVVLGADGEPELADVAEPDGPGELVRIRACGLCGSDVEKIGSAPQGTVLGHEVVAETAHGDIVALVHHASCGECQRCLAGHESTCETFSAPTIRPGGFAQRARVQQWVDVPQGLTAVRATMIEPLACVLRSLTHVPRGRVLVVGHGFIGRLFAAVLRRRGDEVFAVDSDPRRSGPAPDSRVAAAVLSGRGGVDTALDALEPGGTLLVFADAGDIPAQRVYRGELTVVGSRSATPHSMREAAALLPDLDLPEPTVLPLERFMEGLELHRRREVLKVVFAP